MNKNKKLIALALSLGLVAGAAGTLNLVSADAAIKEQRVADQILTTTGDIHFDWETKGDTADTSFKANAQGDFYYDENIPWAVGWLAAWDTATFADGNVTMSFDMHEFSPLMFRPYVAAATVDSALDTIWFNGELVNLTAHTQWAATGTWVGDYYTDETLTTQYDRSAVPQSNLAFFYPFGYPMCAQPYHVEFVFTVDGTLGCKTYAMNPDGTYGAAPTYQIWITNVFAGLNDSTNYYFGLNYTGDTGKILIDDFKLSTPAGTVVETNFSGSWGTQGIPEAGKLHYAHGKTKTIAEVELTPANSDRLVTFEEVTADEVLNEVFKLSGTMDLRDLGKKIGIATGLDDQMGGIYEEGTSYIYFSQIEGITHVTAVNDGVEGTPVSLGADFVAGDFYNFELIGTKTGATLTFGGATVELELTNLEGYLAFVTDGEGTASIALGGTTNLIKYNYRGSEGDAIANNFNTGYVNPANWESQTGRAVMVANPDDAKGIVFEDGMVKFDGTCDGCYFGTSEAYADYVLEFLYSDSFDGDKPALQEGWTAGYSCLSLNMGVIQPGGGWANSVMLFIDDGAFNLLDFRSGNGAGNPTAVNYNFSGAAAGEVKTTAIKVVVANNTINVYYQEVVEGTEPTDAAYILGATYTVPEIYGRVTFATTDSGFFAIDDVRITPIDDPNPETVLANAAAHVGFAPIADEYRPYTLEAPEITMEGTTISWEAIDGATAYVVNVNGTETTVGADVLSFEVEATEPGDYTITVKAIGNGAHISDSAQSDPIEFTVQPVTPPAPPASSSDEGKAGLFGCGGVVVDTMAPVVVAFAAAMLLKKKKEN